MKSGDVEKRPLVLKSIFVINGFGIFGIELTSWVVVIVLCGAGVLLFCVFDAKIVGNGKFCVDGAFVGPRCFGLVATFFSASSSVFFSGENLVTEL